MNRRHFTTLTISAAAAALIRNASAQTLPAVSPGGLLQALPSPVEGPGSCPVLPELPLPLSNAITQKLFPGFKSQFIKTSGATIRVLTKGDGPPLLLLHGHPETHVTWHKVAPALAAEYSVVIPDLRGYGDSSKPAYSENSSQYSFRAMALDQIEVMKQLGHTKFLVASHDRGSRVAHRLCLDHPEAVKKVVFMDIAPTLTMYDGTNKAFATRYLWWFLQIQPSPMPEHLISLDPAYYLREHLLVQSKTPGAVTPDAMAEYIRCYCCKGTIRAVCEDYRAAAGIDLDMDRADDAAGRKVQAPVHALWGAKGTVGELWDVLATWKSKVAGPLTGKALPCGHLLPEEQPELVLAELRAFFNS
ncbi:alpha/beta fold hydrolase [Pseudomonas sp. B22129]